MKGECKVKDKCLRNELKYIISPGAGTVLRSRLRKILPMDKHCNDKSYLIKSLYFDSINDGALGEKLSGAPYREKYRIRCYNNDYSYIKLEKKVKVLAKGYKLTSRLSAEEVEQILAGNLDFLKHSEDPVRTEFYMKYKTKFLRPSVIVQYEREAFTYRPGNTRVTLDFNVRSSIINMDYFSNVPLINDGSDNYILEVKFDRFLPDVIRDLVQIGETSCVSHSKYKTGRMLTM